MADVTRAKLNLGREMGHFFVVLYCVFWGGGVVVVSGNSDLVEEAGLSLLLKVILIPKA